MGEAIKKAYPKIEIEAREDGFKIINASSLPYVPSKGPPQSKVAPPFKGISNEVSEILRIAKSEPGQTFLVSGDILNELRESDPEIEISILRDRPFLGRWVYEIQIALPKKVVSEPDGATVSTPGGGGGPQRVPPPGQGAGPDEPPALTPDDSGDFEDISEGDDEDDTPPAPPPPPTYTDPEMGQTPPPTYTDPETGQTRAEGELFQTDDGWARVVGGHPRDVTPMELQFLDPRK